MDIGSIFLILALLIPVLLFITRPLLERSSATADGSEPALSALLAQRDQVVATIQELDDDYHLGKIPAATYPDQRITLLNTGVGILRQIDTYQAQSVSQSAEDRLEDAIVSRRLALESAQLSGEKTANAVPPVPDDDLEQRIASRRRQMNEKAGGFCPKCGRPVHAADHFCPKCGASLI